MRDKRTKLMIERLFDPDGNIKKDEESRMSDFVMKSFVETLEAEESFCKIYACSGFFQLSMYSSQDDKGLKLKIVIDSRGVNPMQSIIESEPTESFMQALVTMIYTVDFEMKVMAMTTHHYTKKRKVKIARYFNDYTGNND